MALDSTCQSGMSKQLCKESNDIISNLPLHITECILVRLPYYHVARMSILSRYWRYKWLMLPQVILDQTFFNHALKQFEKGSIEAILTYSKIIENILHRHIGPIHKLDLTIPSWMFSEIDIDQWLLLLNSPSSIKEFVLKNHIKSLSQKLPACLYSFVGLTQLTLFNCHDLNLPPTFKGFPCLISMDLHMSGVPVGALEAQMLEKLISLCSRLQKLTLCILGKIINFTICAPELEDLVVKGIMSSLSLKATRNIKTIGVDAVLLQDAGFKRSMGDFFGSLLSCHMLVLHKSFWYTMRNCKLYCGLEPPEKLGKDLESLQTLKLLEVPLNCNYAVPFILCLFRSSPHLQRICINASSFEKCSGKSVQNQNKGNFTLPCLKYVEFVFKASMELELIKILLACSPALEVMTIVLSETLSAENKLEIAKELMLYDRASPKAEIILKP